MQVGRRIFGVVSASFVAVAFFSSSALAQYESYDSTYDTDYGYDSTYESDYGYDSTYESDYGYDSTYDSDYGYDSTYDSDYGTDSDPTYDYGGYEWDFESYSDYSSWDYEVWGDYELSWDQFATDSVFESSYSDYFDSLTNDLSYDFDSYWDYDYDVDCPDIGRQVYVGGIDSYGPDADGDGLGCEDWS